MPLSPADLITPILLSGGVGTRLWPLSRRSYPKQFAPLLGEKTLFQSALSRVKGAGFAPPLILTNAQLRFIVTEQLAAMEIDPDAILLEPEGRNTAPAILAAALYLQKTDPERLLLITPSDHLIPDTVAFRATVASGIPAARSGQIVTFGVRPIRGETGYGYLELEEPLTQDSDRSPLPLLRFVEKPGSEQANDMVRSGRYLWNAGIFLVTVETLLAAFKTHARDMVGPVGKALANSVPDLGFVRLEASSWAETPEMSVDYAIMEHADNIVTIPFNNAWSDLGSWNSVWRSSPRNEQGVALSGSATAIDCEDTLLRSEDQNLEIVGIGLKDIIAVATADAVLVVHADRSQSVGAAVTQLTKQGTAQAEIFRKDHRPWGWFESLSSGPRFQVKRIVVHPGAALSLQSHLHRAEHWVVVEGTAEVTVNDTIRLISENQSIYVPLGATHRLRNPGKLPMVLIEVQTGSYLGEDDIVRYEDAYARS